MRISWLAAALAIYAPLASAPGQFERELTLPPLLHPQAACAVLDARATAYAAGPNAGMTLWADSRPVPFALTINSPEESSGDPAKIANFRTAANSTSFDLLMPARSYSSVTLDLAAPGTSADAIWQAQVGSGAGANLGRFVLFDLSAANGPIHTTVDFAERSDPLLHITLQPAISRAQLRGAWIAPSRSQQTLFTTVAELAPTKEAIRTVAQFSIPQGVPVERVAFQISGTEAFRRHVTVTTAPTTAPENTSVTPDVAAGYIQQIHAQRNGVLLDAHDLSLPAVLPDNTRSPMRVIVTVDNGNAPPLPIRTVQLQMRRRQICFTAGAGVSHWRLFYGPAAAQFTTLGSPPRSLIQRESPMTAQLGPEKLAADFHPLSPPASSPTRPLWLVLALVLVSASLLAMLLRIARIPHIRQ